MQNIILLVFALFRSVGGFVCTPLLSGPRSTRLYTYESAFEAMTVKELRAHLKRRNQSTVGRKSELIERALQAEPAKKQKQALIKESAVVDRLKRDYIENLGYSVVDTSAEDLPRVSTGVLVLGNNTSSQVIDAMATVSSRSVFLETQKLLEGWDYLKDTKGADAIGLLAFGDEALSLALNLNKAWTVVIAWNLTAVPKEIPSCPTLVLIEKTYLDVAIEIKKKLAAFSADSLVRVFDTLPKADSLRPKPTSSSSTIYVPQDDPNLQDEAILLSTAWIELHLLPSDTLPTAGPRANSLWID